MLFNPSILKILGQNISHKAIFTTKFPHFSHQSNIHDKIAVISVKIFCEPKYFLVSRIPRYTIISTSAYTQEPKSPKERYFSVKNSLPFSVLVDVMCPWKHYQAGYLK